MSLAEAMAQAVTDGGDPTTWVQAIGATGLIGVLVGLLVWLLRLISGSGKDARTENTRLDKQVAERDRTIERERKECAEEQARLRAAVEKERAGRFRAEEDSHACHLEIVRLEQLITTMGERRAREQAGQGTSGGRVATRSIDLPGGAAAGRDGAGPHRWPWPGGVDHGGRDDAADGVPGTGREPSADPAPPDGTAGDSDLPTEEP